MLVVFMVFKLGQRFQIGSALSRPHGVTQIPFLPAPLCVHETGEVRSVDSGKELFSSKTTG